MSEFNIFVRELRLDAEVGIHEHERGVVQPLIFNISVAAELGEVDGIDDTICYESIANSARAVLDAGHIELVETIAERLWVRLAAEPRITRATIRIEKPNAIASAGGVGIEIVRRR